MIPLASSPPSNASSLPYELILHIFSYLEPYDLFYVFERSEWMIKEMRQIPAHTQPPHVLKSMHHFVRLYSSGFSQHYEGMSQSFWLEHVMGNVVWDEKFKSSRGLLWNHVETTNDGHASTQSTSSSPGSRIRKPNLPPLHVPSQSDSSPSNAEFWRDFVRRVHQHMDLRGEISRFYRSQYDEAVKVSGGNLVDRSTKKNPMLKFSFTKFFGGTHHAENGHSSIKLNGAQEEALPPPPPSIISPTEHVNALQTAVAEHWLRFLQGRDIFYLWNQYAFPLLYNDLIMHDSSQRLDSKLFAPFLQLTNSHPHPQSTPKYHYSIRYVTLRCSLKRCDKRPNDSRFSVQFTYYHNVSDLTIGAEMQEDQVRRFFGSKMVDEANGSGPGHLPFVKFAPVQVFGHLKVHLSQSGFLLMSAWIDILDMQFLEDSESYIATDFVNFEYEGRDAALRNIVASPTASLTPQYTFDKHLVSFAQHLVIGHRYILMLRDLFSPYGYPTNISRGSYTRIQGFFQEGNGDEFMKIRLIPLRDDYIHQLSQRFHIDISRCETSINPLVFVQAPLHNDRLLLKNGDLIDVIAKSSARKHTLLNTQNVTLLRPSSLFSYSYTNMISTSASLLIMYTCAKSLYHRGGALFGMRPSVHVRSSSKDAQTWFQVAASFILHPPIYFYALQLAALNLFSNSLHTFWGLLRCWLPIVPGSIATAVFSFESYSLFGRWKRWFQQKRMLRKHQRRVEEVR
uniref:F-box domain-containing protein n=1 Tax=Percolomonas cosmopolitus TaxID=63605 RepID=A0A7S1KMT3_9EUKA|mmetsp:Transcript_1930/g.6908  ORF Transcript_1930/g.6908 Transcript_1930/m.6908 type:complete len:735 (+) Transcript_1930:164-2368(+)|eukprot:CAMPEP_0117436588 /NCGR_PEP_ID=MMETSP0759-20121206/1085_1 /TAXON_ID=63605 /ORGANISM="Percolomonas cosmopolitus, Strain WS" /LENGTH=734 /DNA_ID=CAMNT_0005228193 /DNA_START=29 /DNA_END=2233 /DNA_ORIENTATION=+